MNLLAFETSSRLGSVALETAGGLAVRELGSPREQTERLLAITDELLAAAQLDLASLDGIAFGRGPGSFTGLRVSVAVAQGLAAASGVPLLPVSSLLCLAERALERCFEPGALGEAQQARDGQQPHPAGGGQALRDRHADTQARERPGAAAERDGVEALEVDPRRGQ